MPRIIVKNKIGNPILIEDLGIEIPKSSPTDLTEICDLIDIIESKDLGKLVKSKKVIINDGICDLNPTEGLNHIRIRTVHEINSTFLNKWHVGKLPPRKFQNGDRWFCISNGILYVQDDRRSKWLSVSRQTTVFSGRGYSDNELLQLGNVSKSKFSSFSLIRPATITSITAVTDSAFWTNKKKRFSILDKTGTQFEFQLINGKFRRDHLDVDVNEEIQCYVERHGWPVKNPIVTVEYAWRWPHDKHTNS